MACACIGILRTERLDESFRTILRNYQEHVIEDTCWFSIELEWHMKREYTDQEKLQLAEAFGRFPEQEILIFGECDRIFVAAYELIRHFGGLLSVNLGDNRENIKAFPGKKIPIIKHGSYNTSGQDIDYWLVDHIFIKEYFIRISGDNFERFCLTPFLPTA
jgi:hypothetical protein